MFMNTPNNDTEDLFKFIHPNENDMLSQMKGIDLQYFLVLLDEYYLVLREQLGLAKDATFGLELEFEHAMRRRIEDRLMRAFPDFRWCVVDDDSLEKGAEINSPVLTDKEQDWKELYVVCDIVSEFASIDKNAGGHIHVGTQVLGENREDWFQLIKLWLTYENIIYRFAYGDYLTARPGIKKYAMPVAEQFDEYYELFQEKGFSFYEMLKWLSKNRYQGVNFQNVLPFHTGEFSDYNTIEFRCPNGSLDAVIWQNNVNLFTKLLSLPKSASYDEDIVENRRIVNSNMLMDMRLYDEVYLQQALEFADLVFTNNLDKIYFLKQYLKSFEIHKINDGYTKTKPFTKKK